MRKCLTRPNRPTDPAECGRIVEPPSPSSCSLPRTFTLRLFRCRKISCTGYPTHASITNRLAHRSLQPMPSSSSSLNFRVYGDRSPPALGGLSADAEIVFAPHPFLLRTRVAAWSARPAKLPPAPGIAHRLAAASVQLFDALVRPQLPPQPPHGPAAGRRLCMHHRGPVSVDLRHQFALDLREDAGTMESRVRRLASPTRWELIDAPLDSPQHHRTSARQARARLSEQERRSARSTSKSVASSH
jgi:hypothetical protein